MSSIWSEANNSGPPRPFLFFGLKIPMDMLIVTHGDQMGEQLRVELCIYQAQLMGDTSFVISKPNIVMGKKLEPQVLMPCTYHV